jgi:hypothetical protein
LLEYDFDLVYRPGRLNSAPDLHQAQQNDSLQKILQDGPSLQSELFNLLHQHPTSCHLSIQKTFQCLHRLYWFPNMFLWIKNKVNQCHSCQGSKTSRIILVHRNWLPSNPSAHPFNSIAIDSC